MLWIPRSDPETEALVARLARELLGGFITAQVASPAERDAMLADLDRELAGRTDPTVVRRNCAYCGRERTRRDDNHAPSCGYWRFVRAVQGVLGREDR